MLRAVAILSLVGVARLLIWTIDPRPRRVTAGMLIIAAATALFVPSVGEQTIAHALRFAGANVSNLAVGLLTMLFCCWLVVSLTARDWTRRKLWCWRAFPITAALTTLAAYPLSDQLRIPADEFELHDPGSMVAYWAIALCITI